KNTEPAIGIDFANVARAQPASVEGFGRCLRVVEIAAHERGIAQQHFPVAVLRQSAVIAGNAPAPAPGPAHGTVDETFLCARTGNPVRSLGHAVHIENTPCPGPIRDALPETCREWL